MDDNIKQKLQNAPIKNVVIGLSIEDLFENPETIESFYEQSSLKDKFCNKEQLKSVKFEISEKPKIVQDVAPGFMYTNTDKTETIFIELNTIRYNDNSKYESYEKFIEKFSSIVDNIFSYTGKAFKVKEIGLRYINCFNIESNKLDDEFLIYPTVKLATNLEDINTSFAAMNNYLSMANVQSQRNPNVFATIKTVYKAISPQLLDITFDIDTHDATGYTLNSKEELYEKVSCLKEFKNMIFFSNFKNAYEMKEFQ